MSRGCIYTLWDTSLILYFRLRDLCYKLRGRTYTWTDVYVNYDARLLHRKLYAWSNAYRKKVNAKVRNYDLRNEHESFEFINEWLAISTT